MFPVYILFVIVGNSLIHICLLGSCPNIEALHIHRGPMPLALGSKHYPVPSFHVVVLRPEFMLSSLSLSAAGCRGRDLKEDLGEVYLDMF